HIRSQQHGYAGEKKVNKHFHNFLSYYYLFLLKYHRSRVILQRQTKQSATQLRGFYLLYLAEKLRFLRTRAEHSSGKKRAHTQPIQTNHLIVSAPIITVGCDRKRTIFSKL